MNRDEYKLPCQHHAMNKEESLTVQYGKAIFSSFYKLF